MTREIPHKEAMGHNYEELEQQFYYDPPLRPKIVEKYLIEHFKLMRATWKL
jgi:hypothetical protein